MTQDGKAVLYVRTQSNLISPQEIAQLAALRTFADAQGWELEGAAVEQKASHRLWDVVREEFESGEFSAVIMWDDEHDYPGVWTDDLPVL